MGQGQGRGGKGGGFAAPTNVMVTPMADAYQLTWDASTDPNVGRYAVSVESQYPSGDEDEDEYEVTDPMVSIPMADLALDDGTMPTSATAKVRCKKPIDAKGPNRGQWSDPVVLI